MSMTISVLGGVGLFLLGMNVMTSGLKALAGSGLRTTLSKAAATPLSGTFWGAFVTLIVQSSSATTMTTIGLVSAGLLTFSQGLGLVFGANIGTTGTAWLIALIGVRISLTAYALPMIFVGALIMLLGRGRLSAAGAALAGFALVLFGLTTLQQGMTGLAEQLHPADLPAVFGSGTNWWSSLLGVLALIVVGLAMTAVMQSSTAAVAVTLSAQFAGAIGLDQACALVIGQNIGTATSSALAAIGASRTAQRLALAYILFKVIAAAIALILFPVTVPWLVRASNTVDGVTLIAAYHTAFNVVGVAVMLPLVDGFTRFVERMIPDRGSPLIRNLDPAALSTPIAAEEAVRRTVARALREICGSIREALTTTNKRAVAVSEAGEALHKAQDFISEASGPAESADEQERFTRTLHALDHASRLAEVAGEKGEFGPAPAGTEGVRAAELCAEAMRNAVVIADHVIAPPDAALAATPVEEDALVQLDRCARTLDELQRTHRKETLRSVADGAMSADDAITRVDTVRWLEALAHHAWRSAMYLLPPP
jgi:phosphate:Na+ symporter